MTRREELAEKFLCGILQNPGLTQSLAISAATETPNRPTEGFCQASVDLAFSLAEAFKFTEVNRAEELT